MSLPREIDFSSESYGPNNKDHKHYINEQIRLHNRYREELEAPDIKLGIVDGIGLLAWLVGVINLEKSMLVFAAHFLVNKFYLSRDLSKADEQLQKLYETYLWCAENGPSITHDPTFQQLLESMAGYIKDKKYLLLEQLCQPGLSNQFKETMSRSPYCVQFVELKQENKKTESSQSLVSNICQFFSSNQQQVLELKNQNKLTESISNKKINTYGIFAQSCATAKLYIYGYEPKKLSR